MKRSHAPSELRARSAAGRGGRQEASGASRRTGRHVGREPSQRQLRIGEAVRHVLAELLRRDVAHHPVLAESDLTVSEVRVSPDLRRAVVFVTELGGDLRPQVRRALEQTAPALRGEVARLAHLKYAPDLAFEPDTSFAEAARIEALIAHERATLGDRGEDDDGRG